MRHHRAGARRRGRDRGSVTAETALAMPAVMVVLAVLLGTGQVVIGQVRCVDAARAGARAAARGDPAAQVRTVVAALAPAGADVTVVHEGGLVRVGVTSEVLVPMPSPAVPLTCSAVAATEVPGMEVPGDAALTGTQGPDGDTRP